VVESTNQVQVFHEPPSLRPHCSSAHQWVTPELGLSSTPRQGILGWAEVTGKTKHNHKEGILSKEPPTLTAHRPSFPTCLFHPRSIHLLCHLDTPSAANLPCLGLQEQAKPEVSGLYGSYKVPSRSSLLPLRTLSPGGSRSQVQQPVLPTSTTSLTWRECCTNWPTRNTGSNTTRPPQSTGIQT
jgi:hypothetical protein